MFANKSHRLYSVLSIITIFSLALSGFEPVRASYERPARVESGIAQTDTTDSLPDMPHVPGVVLVGLKDGISLDGSSLLTGDRDRHANITSLETRLKSLKVRKVEKIFDLPQEALAEQPNRNNGETGGQQDLTKIYRLKLDPGADMGAAMQSLSSNSDILFAEPDYIAVQADLFTDPLYSVQWGMTQIDIENAWDDTTGAATTLIAILDSGIDLTHIDLAGQLWVNPGEIAGNSKDDDNNGYVDDVDGWNFVNSNKNVSDDNGHGTLVAGVAAAIGGNNQGIVGVCPLCTILPVKVMQSSGVANYSDIAAGVLYAALKGAKVINLSLGGYADSNTLRNAINTAVNTYGVVVVAGAGNDNLSTPFYPAAYGNVLAVAGTDNTDAKLNFSNYGSWVDVSAPASDIRTTALGGDWANGSGTSIAAPFAAGLAGLLRTMHPDWSQATIRSQIAHTTDEIDSLNPTFVGMLGSGRLNAAAAMEDPHPLLSMGSYSINGQVDGRPLKNATATMTVTLQNDWWDAAGVIGTLTTTDTYVTILNGSASYGDIPAGTSKTNTTNFTFSVANAAGYNHPIPFTLDVTDTSGYAASFDFTVITESGVVNKEGTINTDTWTNNKTYLITGNLGVAPGNTLTIQPGTTIKFNGNFNLKVGGTLIADGTSEQPILFQHNTTGTWGNILFDNSSTDATADGSGNYLSGSILRYVNIESSSGGIDCTSATPYLSHINLDGGGVVCPLGVTPIWFLDNTITGGVSFTGAGNAYRNMVSGNLSISGTGVAEDNVVHGNLSLGGGTASSNTVSGGNLMVGGSGGSIEDNSVGGNLTAGATFSVLRNSVSGSLSAGNSVTVDHNTVSNGITAGSSATVTWNDAEGASGVGLAAGSNVTAQYNRLVGNVTGMTATTGLIEHNLIANNRGVGLQVGAATVRYNTLTGNEGNTIKVQGGNPLTIEYNNLEGNSGTYDLYVNIASGVNVIAQHNWWGTTNNLKIAERIFDYNDDYNFATVNFYLKLVTPDQTAPGYVRGVTVLPDTTLGIQTGTFQVDFSREMNVNVTPLIYAGQNWMIRLNMPTSRNEFGIALASNGRIYAIGGNGGGFLNTVEEYDPETDTWATRSPSPRAGVVWAAASTNGKIYAIYGKNTEEYDPATDTWRTCANIPTSRYGLGVVAGSNGRIYAIGGETDKFLDTVEEYDPETDTWRTRANMPTARVNIGVVAGNDGKIYVIGGFPYQTTVEEYDPVTDTWKIRANMLTARSQLGVVVGNNGRIYAIGGWNGSSLSTVEEYDPITDTWISRADMPTARSGLGVVADSSGRIYAIGGKNGSFLSTVEELTILLEASDFHSSKWLISTQFQSRYDITSLVPKDTYRVTVADAYDSDGMRMAPNSDTTFVVDYAGFISDKTPPSKPVVTVTGDGGLTNLSASWNSRDTESPIVQYRYAIGTTPGGRQVVDWTYTTRKTMIRNNLNLTKGLVYYVSAGARNEGGLWSESGVSTGVIAGEAPTNLQASDGTYTNKVHLSWAAFSAATAYKVYRAESAGGVKTLLGSPTSRLFADTTATPGITYTYWVKACINANCTGTSALNTGWRKLSPPTIVKASDGNYTDKVQLSWNAASGATIYKIYRSTRLAGAKTFLANRTSITFADTTATPGLTYFYWVIACKEIRCSLYSASNTGWRKLSPPTNLQASDGTYANMVQVSWTASNGATSYKVYRSNTASSQKVLLGSTNKLIFNDTKGTKGVTYYYWVRACRGTRASGYSAFNTGWR